MNTLHRRILAAAFLAAASTATVAMPVDLSGWVAEGGTSNWVVQAGNDAVLQTVNGAPTVFYDPSTVSTFNTALTGNITVTTTADDDFIGFFLGYQTAEIFSPTADFFVVEWKQLDQAGWDAGLGISYVTDGSNGNSANTGGSYWQHPVNEVTEIARATNLGNVGWVDNQQYSFSLVFTDSLIEVIVDGSTEISITPADVAGINSFTDGSFGFYNYSQANVLYGAIAQVDCSVTPNDPSCVNVPPPVVPPPNVPVPAPLMLLPLGLVALRVFNRRMANSQTA